MSVTFNGSILESQALYYISVYYDFPYMVTDNSKAGIMIPVIMIQAVHDDTCEVQNIT